MIMRLHQAALKTINNEDYGKGGVGVGVGVG